MDQSLNSNNKKKWKNDKLEKESSMVSFSVYFLFIPGKITWQTRKYFKLFFKSTLLVTKR